MQRMKEPSNRTIDATVEQAHEMLGKLVDSDYRRPWFTPHDRKVAIEAYAQRLLSLAKGIG